VTTAPDDRLPARQAAVIAGLGLLDSPADREIADAVLAAVAATGMAYGTVNLLDGSRQCQLATHGFAGADSPREESLCAEVTGGEPDVYAFTDLAREVGFTGNPWVDGRRARVRAYASAPLVVEGVTIGTLCVFDDQPRALTLAACDRLGELAADLSRALGRRRAAARA
jgi:GAF domain-containing protein